MSDLDVVIPTKNCRDDLESCLISLSKQILPVNVIVVDAYSTDGTREIALKHRAYLVDEPPSIYKGSRRAVACNEGLRHVTGFLVGFLDADVIVPPTWSRDMIEFFSENRGQRFSAVTSGCVSKHRSKLEKAISTVLKSGSTHAHGFMEVQVIESVPGYNSVYLCNAIDEAGGYNEKIGGCEDWELNYRLRKRGWRLLGIPFSPVVHRERRTLRSFARQIYGYGWSRARLWTRGGVFSPKHCLPTLALLVYVLLMVKWPFLLILSMGTLAISCIFNSSINTVVQIIFFMSWALGYLKGLTD